MVDSGGTQQQYRYDAAGRLAQVLSSGGATLATYSYGAGNQRLMSVEGGVTTCYGWDGGQVIAEYEPSGASGLLWKTGYVYLGGRLLATTNAGGTRFHHPDRLGTNVVTDQSNVELVTKQMGLPYGTQQPSGAFGGDNSWQHSSKTNPSRKRFTSYDRSAATGLDYAVNRHYSSAQGRFTQVDPIGMSAVSLGDPQSLNLYAYCGNDPVNRLDPDGLFWGKLFGWIGKVVKWVAIAVTVAIVVLTVIPAAWAGVALGKLLVFLAAHKTIAGILGLGGIAGSFSTPGINGAGVGGVNNFFFKDPPEQNWWDWATTDGLQNLSDAIAGFGDTLSLGITRKIRKSGGYDRAVDPCSGWYVVGDATGTIYGLAMGGISTFRAVRIMGGVRGGLAKGARRFFSDPRNFKTISRQYWEGRRGANGWHLHHWLIPRRAGGPNAGWNLLELPGNLNSWMNGTSLPRNAAEWAIRVAVPGSVLGGGVQGGRWGVEKQGWKANCEGN